MIKSILDLKSGKVEPWAALQLASYTILDALVDFQEDGHIYTFKGVRLYSTTQILKTKGYIDDTWYKRYDYNRELGKNVHLLTHLYDIDDLDEDTVGPVELPYLEAYLKFKRESGFVVEESEVPKGNLKYMVAGTADKRGNWDIPRAALELHSDGTYKLYPYKDRNDIKIWLAELPGFFWQLNHL